MIQIRNVPEEIHRHAKSRAAMCGLTLSEYVLRELKKALEYPTRDEILKRLATRQQVSLPQSAADLVREERENR